MPTQTLESDTFARVNGTVIPAKQFDLDAQESFKRKFFHGKPPEAAVQKMLFEVGQNLIDEPLLLEEAKRRGISAEKNDIAARLNRFISKIPDLTDANQRATVIVAAEAHFTRLSTIAALESAVRNVVVTPDDALAFYQSNPTLFTEPERNKVSLILLRVQPSDPPSAWEETQKRAEKLRERLVSGESFAALAREHSQDSSAEAGGVLGYVHQGVLNGAIEEDLKKLKPGELGTVVRSLEGWVIARLDDRQAAALRPFNEVSSRASDLARRHQSEQAWKTLLDRLRNSATIEIGPAFLEIMNPRK